MATPLTLRPYQVEAITAIEKEWQQPEGASDLLLVMATGGGKTVVLLEVLNRLMHPGTRGLILAHRKELIDQPIERIQTMFPALAPRAGVVMAERNEVSKDLIVATIQTLASEKRLRQLLSHGKFDYLVTDEAHHSVSASNLKLYETLKQVNPALKHLGVTATPMRSDGDGLAKVYQKVIAKYGIVELIQGRYLAPCRWLAIQTGISLKGIRIQAGDFSARQLADVYETGNCFELVVETHKKYAAERLALAYTVSVEGAHHLAAKFNAAGIPAAAADGTTSKEERQTILNRFRRGEIRVLANCALFTEGLDVPEVSCIHQVRPTQSDGLYIQIIGRALRTFPGKTDALILDYAPKDARNIAMFGDILGVPLDKKHYIKEQVEKEEDEGEVQSGFTFDGDEYRFLNGNPMEIVARELHYLELSPWSWNRTPDGWMTLGLGEASDKVKRTLVIRPPQNGHDQYTLYLAAQRPEDPYTKAYRVQDGPFDVLHAWGENYANQRGNATLAAKQRTWRKEPPSQGQIQFAKRLGIFKPGLSKGDLANLITSRLATDAVERTL